MARSPLLALPAAFLAVPALADVPNVVADIAPIHSLVAQVMEGVGTPDLVIPPGASPHEHSLRPSEASALQDADLVFWVGDDLTPWLEDAIETLAEGADVTALLEAEGVRLLDFREGASFEAHDHGDEHGDHGHGAEEAADRNHVHDDDHEAHPEGGHDHGDEDHAEAGHDDHDHGAHDPHAWLSPDNAAVWLNVVAAELSAADPGNAGAYFANAAAGIEEMEALKAEVAEVLAPVEAGSFIVFHDAYQYFEDAFGVSAAGAISLSDAADPSPARIEEIRARVQEVGVGCVLSEPQFNAALVATVLEGTEAETAVLDPLGSDLEPGPALYPQLMRNLADALAGCG